MRRKLVSVGIVLLALVLLLTLGPACGNGGEEPELTPTPPKSEAYQHFSIEVVKPTNARVLNWAWVIVWVTCKVEVHYQPDEVNFAFVGVSFPELSDVENVRFWSSTLENHRIYGPGDKVYTDYGRGGQITAKYPVLEGYKSTWTKGDKEYIAFEVLPEQSGRFTFYVKAYGSVQVESTLVTLYEPDSGTKDQQNEYVQVHRFQVAEPIQ